MASAYSGDVGRHLGRLFGAGSAVGLSDGELLERFAHRRDESAEAAFETILARHGSLVLTVCRQVLGDAHAAEDAFQATFLVLVRRAGSLRVREPGSLGPWLYGVAYRIALKARQGAARRRAREHRATVPVVGAPSAGIEQGELRALLHEEVNRLPAKYRAPVVLCCFEGRTHDEAAAALGWPVGTVRGRLARARDRLRARLTRRGLAPDGWIGSSLLEPAVRITPPARLLEATVAAAIEGTPAASVSTMANLMLRGLLMARLPMAAAVLSIALTVAGVGLALSSAPALQPGPRPDTAPAPVAAARTPTATVDRFGDPLPKYARARFGSNRFHHADTVNQALYTPDGRCLIAVDNSGAIRVWDAATGRMIRTIGGPPNYFRHVALSPDGLTLVTIEDPGLLRIWDLASGRERRSWHATRGPCWCLAFSPDGRTVAAGMSVYDQANKSEEKFINLWDITAPTERRRRIVGDWRDLVGLVFSPDGKTLISGSIDTESRVVGAKPEKGSTRLWDLATGRERARFPVEGCHVRSVAISPDGRFLAVGVSDQTIRVYDLGTGRERALRLGPEGARGLEMQGVLVPAPGPAVPISPGVMRCLAFSPDGSVLASGSSGTGDTGSTLLADVYLWDVANGKELLQFPAHQACVASLSFSPDGRALASTGPEPMIRIWDVATGRESFPQTGHRTWIRTLVVSPVDGTVFTGGQDGTIRHWDAATGRELAPIGPFASPIHTLAIAHDGKTLLVVGAFGAPVLWSTERGAEIRPISETPQPGQGTIWETASGKVVTTTRDQNGKPTVSFPMLCSPDSKEGITVDREGVTIRNVASAKEVRRAIQSRIQYYNPALSPDGRFLATNGWDESRRGGKLDPAIHIWELTSGQEVATVEGHQAATRALAFSPDGRFLASGSVGNGTSNDVSVRVWDVATGRERRRFDGHLAAINAVAFSPDGRSVVSASEDATALVWDVSDLADQPRTDQPLTAEAMKAWWDELAGNDARAAYRSIWALSVPSAIPFLREHLRPATSGDPKGIPAASGPIAAPEVLRTMRAVAALERVGTPEARAVLERMAQGNPDAILTRDAKSAQERLIRRVVDQGTGRE